MEIGPMPNDRVYAKTPYLRLFACPCGHRFWARVHQHHEIIQRPPCPRCHWDPAHTGAGGLDEQRRFRHPNAGEGRGIPERFATP